MSFFAAAIWSVSAVAALDFFLALAASVGPSAELDLVSRVLCEAAAFVSTLLLLTLVHERDRPLTDVLALRRTPVALLLLATLFGFALQGPVNLVAGAIYHRYPLPQEQIELLRRLFDVRTFYQKAAIVLFAGVVGPVVEELLFRGGILGGLRRRHASFRTVIGVALFFALAHREPRNFLPDLMGGLAMGYARLTSGSLWPGILLHAAFNTTSVIFAFVAGPDADVLARTENLAAAAISVALLAGFGWIAGRHELCVAARAADATPEAHLG
jgi:membrane protease YdiL (CAAX protease family)